MILFRFYQLNDGNVTKGQEDAEMYITMAANEVGLKFVSVTFTALSETKMKRWKNMHMN